jgi:uridine nucleosidase
LNVKTTLITLDLTHLCLAKLEVREKLLKGGDKSKPPSKLRVMLEEILGFFASGYDNFFGMSDGPPLHDPLAVAALLPCAGILKDEGDRYVVTIVTAGEHVANSDEDLDIARGQIGRTVVTISKSGKGVRIPRVLNANAFWQTLSDCCTLAEDSF